MSAQVAAQVLRVLAEGERQRAEMLDALAAALEEPRMMSVKEFAFSRSISEHTVRRMIDSGELFAEKQGGQWRIAAVAS